jgi:hypothetical protein
MGSDYLIYFSRPPVWTEAFRNEVVWPNGERRTSDQGPGMDAEVRLLASNCISLHARSPVSWALDVRRNGAFALEVPCSRRASRGNLSPNPNLLRQLLWKRDSPLLQDGKDLPGLGPRHRARLYFSS